MRLDERGLALSVWTAMALPAFIVAVGIGVDFSGHATVAQEARAIAAEAARAATHEIVIGPAGPVLDVPRARSAALNFANVSGYSAAVTVSGGSTATVRISSTYDTVFLGLIGIHEIGFDVSGSARAVRTLNGTESG